MDVREGTGSASPKAWRRGSARKIQACWSACANLRLGICRRSVEPNRFTTTLVMRELPQPRESYIHLGGDFLRKGAPVKPGVPAVLPPMPAAGEYRLDLAKWLVDPQNPLTSRVTVNRIWQAYFGKGIVETENDFGIRAPARRIRNCWTGWPREFIRAEVEPEGDPPADRHVGDVPAVLDAHGPRLEAVDPDNKLLARQNRLRLEAEIIRDSALAASGLLTATVGGPSVYPPIPEGAMAVTQVKRAVAHRDRARPLSPRPVHLLPAVVAAYPGLASFDAPDATSACTRRIRSNTPLQALTTAQR